MNSYFMYVVLPVLSFGQPGEMAAPINLLHKISYRQCIDRCSEWSDCHSAKYYKLMKLCKLYRDKHSYGDEDYKDISFYVKPDSMINQQAGQHSNPQLYCGEPRQIGGATLYGNMRINGAKLKYVCVGDKKMSAITECLGGNWSEVDLVCPCGEPRQIGGATLYGNSSQLKYVCVADKQMSAISQCLGGNWSEVDLICPCGNYTFEHYQGDILLKVKEHNATYVEGELTCADEKSELRTSQAPICSIARSKWYYLDKACCDVMHDGTWTKVHNWRSDSRGYLKYPWVLYLDPEAKYINQDIDQQCFYRNTTALLNWSTLDIQRVKLTILKDDEIVVFMTFSGEGSNHTSWFSMGSLLNSSFTDLTPENMGESGSIQMDHQLSRFYLVASQVNNKRTQCMGTIGWLIATRRTYPCDDPQPWSVRRILYSRNGTRSHFTTQEMEYGDTLQIWIETAAVAVTDANTTVRHYNDEL